MLWKIENDRMRKNSVQFVQTHTKILDGHFSLFISHFFSFFVHTHTYIIYIHSSIVPLDNSYSHSFFSPVFSLYISLWILVFISTMMMMMMVPFFCHFHYLIMNKYPIFITLLFFPTFSGYFFSKWYFFILIRFSSRVIN